MTSSLTCWPLHGCSLVGCDFIAARPLRFCRDGLVLAYIIRESLSSRQGMKNSWVRALIRRSRALASRRAIDVEHQVDVPVSEC